MQGGVHGAGRCPSREGTGIPRPWIGLDSTPCVRSPAACLTLHGFMRPLKSCARKVRVAPSCVPPFAQSDLLHDLLQRRSILEALKREAEQGLVLGVGSVRAEDTRRRWVGAWVREAQQDLRDAPSSLRQAQHHGAFVLEAEKRGRVLLRQHTRYPLHRLLEASSGSHGEQQVCVKSCSSKARSFAFNPLSSPQPREKPLWSGLDADLESSLSAEPHCLFFSSSTRLSSIRPSAPPRFLPCHRPHRMDSEAQVAARVPCSAGGRLAFSWGLGTELWFCEVQNPRSGDGGSDPAKSSVVW
jgi:hypothetical protein